MQWFGPAPFSPACVDSEPIATPLACCAWCDEPFEEGDEGYAIPHLGGDDAPTHLPYHVDCWARQLIGSVAHIERRCGCYVPGAEETDPPELTRREAAQAAVQAAFRARGDLDKL